MTEQVPSEKVTFQSNQPLWYWTERGRVEAQFVKMSASGKRAYVRYSPNELHGGWDASAFVDPKNLEPRLEERTNPFVGAHGIESVAGLAGAQRNLDSWGHSRVKTLHEEMILVVNHFNGKEVSRITVTVRVSPYRYTIISGLHRGDRFARPSGEYVGAVSPLGLHRYHLEPKP